jgi:predicted dehydrogenase
VRSLVEKPPTLTLVDAVALASLDPAPFMGFNRRFDPDLTALHERVRERGRKALRLALELSISPRAWGAYTVEDSPLLNLGPHVVDLACWISGQPPRRVRSVETTDDAERFELEWEDGLAEILVSHGSGWRENADVQDARGRVGRVSAGGWRRRITSRIRGIGSPLPATLGAQLTALASEHRGTPDERLARSGDGIVVMAVLDGVLRSRSDHGSWVELHTADSSEG